MRVNVASYVNDFGLRGAETAFAHQQGVRMKRWSYADTAKAAFQFARELEARRINKGDRVVIWSINRPEWVSAFLGCVLRGVIAVPIDVQSEPGFINRVCEQVGPKLALCGTQMDGFTEQSVPVLHFAQFSSQMSHHSTAAVDVTDIGADDVLEIVFTSGTTAEPKGVAITHRNVLANLVPLEQEIGKYLKWERLVHPLRFLNLVPLSHVFGQLMGIFVPQLLGGEVFFQESLLPSHIIETTRRERISVIVCVPRTLTSLREKIEREYDGDLRFKKQLEGASEYHFIRRWWTFRRMHQMFGWKFWAFVSGGAKLNLDTEDFWQRLGFAVIQGYGMTETASLISVNHPFRKARGSIGKVLAGQQVKLSKSGEILVSGQNVSPGYWDHERQLVRREDRWFPTGDAGEMDAAGNLYFKGRSKEVIVTSSGMNVHPEDIELVLDRQPQIKRSAVVEFDGPHGPEPLAVLIPWKDKADLRTAIERANRSLATHQQVRRWAIWPEADFPLTSTQKVRKQIVAELIKKKLVKGVPQIPAESVGSLEKILTQVSGQTAARVDSSTTLGTDLKLDSLGRVELLGALEDQYRVELDEGTFTEATTVGDIQKLIRAGQSEEPARYPYPRWQQRWPVRWLRIALLYVVVLPITRFMGRATISGRNSLREVPTPAVFVCNHIAMVDHALVLLALPGKIRRRLAIAMDGELLREWRHPSAGTKLFTRVIQLVEYFLVVLFFNVFSMPRKSGFRRSFSFAGELMDDGYSILVFPEGERTKDGKMNRFRAGTGLLISQLDVSVVPLRINGLWELKQADRHFARSGEVSLTIGNAVRFPRGTESEVIVQELEKQVKAL